LLFKGNSINSKVIRTVTAGRYDHVAMILKFESAPEQVYLIEATGNRGVSLNRFDFIRDFIGKKKFYQTLMYRQAKYERNDEVVDRLEVFLKEAIGRQYGIGTKIFSKHKSMKIKKGSDKQFIEENRTFFCSELVAKAFKTLGIIENDDTACSSFLPSHFSSCNDKLLKYTQGTSLTDEMQIIIEGESEAKGTVINSVRLDGTEVSKMN
jgi:hypothetical protein